MGEVFLAEDTRLRRRVALKSVTTRHAARPEARLRLLREARAAAALNHPNIAAIYDVIETDGDMHIVMEYVEGTSLDEIVRRGPLPVRRALRIGLELSEAVAAAHDQGVVHRDLKPSNVRLTTAGHVKVLDFGLARTLDVDAPAGTDADGTTAALTEVDQLVGTPAYMAPEQLRGARGDQKSDVYGLGIVLFELLTGQRPFRAPTTIELAVKAVTQGVPDVRTLRPDAPGDLAALVARATARDPRDRIASAQELRDLLQDVFAEQSPASPSSPLPGPLPLEVPTPVPAPAPPASASEAAAASPQAPFPAPQPPSSVPEAPVPTPHTAEPIPLTSPRALVQPAPSSMRHGAWTRAAYRALAAAVLVALVGVVAWRLRPVPSPSGPEVTPRTSTVVVLPVSAPHGMSELEPAAAGIGEIIAANLAIVPGVHVVSRIDTAAAMGVVRDVQRVLRDLAPNYVVNAAIDGGPDQFDLDVRLLDGKGGVAWTGAYQGVRTDDPFTLPVRVSADVGRAMADAGAVSPQALAAVADRLQKPPTAVREAWAHYTDALRFLDRPDIQGNVARATTLLERAVDRDPRFAMGWAALATAYSMQYDETKDQQWPARVVRANLEALRLDPDRAETRMALAQMYKNTGAYDRAVDELNRAIALSPASDVPRRLLGGLYTDIGRYDEAVSALRQAIDRRPEYWRNWSFLGYAYYKAGRHQDAIPVYERLLELQPDNSRGHAAFGTVLHEMGRDEDARAHYRRALELAPTASAWSNLGTLDYFAGRYEDAARAYQEAITLRPNIATTHRNLGDAFAAAGRRQDAGRAYQTALRLLAQQLATNPRDGDAVSLRSIVEAKLGRLAEARRHAADALALLPDNKEVLYRSAVVATIDGRPEDAARLLDAALARGASIVYARRDPDLAALRQVPAVRERLAASVPSR